MILMSEPYITFHSLKSLNPTKSQTSYSWSMELTAEPPSHPQFIAELKKYKEVDCMKIMKTKALIVTNMNT